mgnify:CR=1 FL=1
MPKNKTHKGISKRVKRTASGKLRHKSAGSGHLMSCKNASRKRSLRKPSFLSGKVAAHIKTMLAN